MQEAVALMHIMLYTFDKNEYFETKYIFHPFSSNGLLKEDGVLTHREKHHAPLQCISDLDESNGYCTK